MAQTDSIPLPLAIGVILIGLLFLVGSSRIGRHGLPRAFQELGRPLGMSPGPSGRYPGIVVLGAGLMLIGLLAAIASVVQQP